VTVRAQLLVLAKEPLPGRAKTRLTPPLSPRQASQVARAALLDTLAAAAQVAVARRTVVLDGSPAGWLPDGYAVLPQRPGDLGARLAGAFADAHAALPLPLLLVGMDTPQVTPALIEEALAALLSPGTDAVLGHAEDGGWWALGLREPAPGLFDGVPMSTGRAGAVQAARLGQLGLATTTLPVLRDLDHVHDLAPVTALQAPGSRLAAVVATLDLVPA
jgi:rSAM/selenodomain-associated transferase 1